MRKRFEEFNKRQIWKSFVAYPAAAFVLLQAVEFFMNLFDLNPKILTLSFILLVGGFVFSVIWNWYHGETGIQKITAKEKMVYVFILILTMGSGVYYWVNSNPGKQKLTQAAEYRSEKLAVLPFENKLIDSSMVYLSDGIPENLINRLARITNFRVLSRNSTFVLNKSERNPEGVSNKLDAELMLTGKLEERENRLIVTCELINVTEGVQIWGEKIYYENDNIIELEENIVSSLIASFPSSIKNEDSKGKKETEIDPEAKVHYMKGRALSYGSTDEEAEKALDHFREAIKIDPAFVDAYVAIADEKIIQAMFSTASREEIFNEARTAVQTALALNPNSAKAFYVDGAIKFYGDFDWDGAEASYKKSIEIDPNNADAYIRYSAFLAAAKRPKESIEMADKAIVLDPISISSLHNLGWVHLVARNFKESEDAFTEALDLYPNWIWGYAKRGYARMFLNKCEAAESDAEKERKLLGESDSELLETTFITIYNYCNNEQKVKELSERFLKQVDENTFTDPWPIFYVYYLNGEMDKALGWAEQCVAQKEASSYLFNIDLFFGEDLLQHPRFIQLKKNMKKQKRV